MDSHVERAKGGEKMNYLNGKKTYLLTGLLFVVGGLKAIGILDENTYQILFSLLIPASIFTLRMGVNSKL